MNRQEIVGIATSVLDAYLDVHGALTTRVAVLEISILIADRLLPTRDSVLIAQQERRVPITAAFEQAEVEAAERDARLYNESTSPVTRWS